nr:FtsX-like permease family protein [uncultured Acetatifactor sp.]
MVLITGLYSFTFLLGSSVENAYLLNYEYRYGSTSHILYQGLTPHQAEKLAQHPNVKSTVRISALGQLSDEMMGVRSVKLAVTDRDYARSVLSVPTTGRLPEKAGEIALDEFTMDSLGVLHELGAPVSLQWTDSRGGGHSTDFTLCGWWASPTNFTEACAWVTAECAAGLLPGYPDTASVTMGVDLWQPKELERQAQQIMADQGVSQVAYTTNLAYNEARMEMAGKQATPFYIPALVVLLCGFLMIYSIIHVAMDQDTRLFAGLKTLGMTPRQIRWFLLEKAGLLSLFGLLPGWLIGFGIHYLVTPRIVTGMEQNPAIYFLSWETFALAALSAFGTVVLAYFLPAVRTGGRMPTQMLRNLEERVPKGRGRSSTGKVGILRLALRSLWRNKGRTILSLLSLLLSLLLLCSTWIRYTSYDEDLYLNGMSPWDYTIEDGSAASTVQRYNPNNRAITEQIVGALRGRSEVLEVSVLKSKEVELRASDGLRQRIVDFYNEPYDETMTRRESQAAYPDWCAGLDCLEQTGSYYGIVIALEDAYLRYVLDNCPITSGGFDAEQFADGRYVVAAGAYVEGVSSPAAGETVELGGERLSVLASVMGDTSFLSGSNSLESSFHLTYFVPLSLFDRLFPDEGIRQLAVNIDHDGQEEFEHYLSSYKQSLNRGISVRMRSDYQEVFQNARLNECLPKLIVGIVLMAIGLLNFANMLVTKTMVRRKEFAVYQSLGMTSGQLRWLLLTEGLLHGVLLTVILLPVTFSVTWFGMPMVFSRLNTWCMTYHYTLAPLWAALPFMLFLAAAVPLMCCRFIEKGSITERLRIVA